MQIIKYITEQEAQEIIAEKTAQGLTLIEIANITEGNFLGFDDKPREAKTTSVRGKKEKACPDRSGKTPAPRIVEAV